MKILELYLRAFGPFTDLDLDLRNGNEGLHILFGPNEAGKSSALRALHALLYGIPHNTLDNFIHENNKLRIGSRLRHSDGSELVFLRRKGNKNTLLGPDEKPLNDSVLDRFRQGVGERLFANVFGIDHEALVRGGKDILQGGGEVGQSLFAAGLGGTGLRRILQDLEDEANNLFKPKGQTPVINKAIAEYTEGRRSIGEASLSSREWSELDEVLKKDLKNRDNLLDELRRHAGGKNHLERLQSALPGVGRRRELRKKLADLEGVVILPPEFSERRREFIQKFNAAQEEKRRTEPNLERLRYEVKELVIPEPLLDQAETITRVHERLGSHRKAALDRGKLLGSLQQLKADARAILSELRPDQTIEQAEELRPRVAQRTRIQEFGAQYQPLLKDLERAKKDAQETEKELSESLEEIEALESSKDPSRLKRSVARVLKQGDLEAGRGQLLLQIKAVEDQVRVDLKKLGLWSGALEELERLSIPSSETIDRFESMFQELLTQKTGIEGKIRDSGVEIKEHEQKIEELRLTGAVPTEEELQIARARREEGWNLVRRAWINREDIDEEEKVYDPENALPEAYEKRVRQSDELADRLRREANRVAENASLIARRDKRQEDLRKLEEDKTKTEENIQRIQQEWVGLWQPAGITPLPPREMRPWVIKQGNLLRQAESLRSHRLNLERITQQIQEFRTELSGHLEQLGERRAGDDETLEALCDRSQRTVARIDEAERRRKELQTKMAKLQKDLEHFRQIAQDYTVKLEQWRLEWTEAIASLGLSGVTLPAEANAVLNRFGELFKKLDEAEGYDRRIYGIDQDAKEFTGDLKELVLRLAPDLAGLPVEQAVEQLNARLVKVREASVRMSELKKQIREKEDTLREAEETIELMTERLNALCRQVGCSKYEELAEIEERSSRYQALKKETEDLEQRLLELGGGTSLEELLSEAESVNSDSLPVQISEISHRIEELEQERSELDRKIGSEQAELRRMDGSARAAEAAEKAQGLLADLRGSVDRYIRLHLSSTILRREIERYRTKNQGELLRRASQLFSSLTLGSYFGLQTDYNEKDEPVLLGVRPSGEQVRVEGMSDGTRDQLYLSLRLASLEKYLETNEPMPFVVDDILIKFDDERAAATLRILADLSLKTQVLFFTHHRRLVELAENIHSNGHIVIHSFSSK